MARPNSAPRDLQEMIDALLKQLKLLDEYSQKLFRENDQSYIGEVANKLRLLVARFGSNRPLLLEIMIKTGISPTITLDGPPIFKHTSPIGERPGDVITLESYLNLTATAQRVQNGKFVELKRIDIIRLLAEQYGGAHEDWEISDALRAVLNSKIPNFDIQPLFIELQGTVDTVLSIGDQVLRRLKSGASNEG